MIIKIFAPQELALLNPVTCILSEIYDYIRSETKKPSAELLAVYPTNKMSYLKSGYCSAAIKKLISFNRESELLVQIVRESENARILAARLETLLSREGKDVPVETTARNGQYLFRRALLDIYENSCAVTSIAAVPVLRASHIVEWSKDSENRLNPTNGICLSATFDAAFDKHLITFDDDYRMLLTSELRSYFVNEETRACFETYEGKQLVLPKCEMFLPSLSLLRKHRNSCRI